MEKISRETYAAALQAALEKRRYKSALREWEDRPRRLLSPRPKDPFPKLERSDFVNLATKAAYPYLNVPQAGPSGPEEKRCRFDCWLDAATGGFMAGYRTDDASTNTFHEELLVYKDGYGLVHSYQESPDREKDSRNRSLAFSRAVGTRHEDSRSGYFSPRNRFMDEVRKDFKELLGLPFSRSEKKAAVEAVNLYIRAHDEQVSKCETVKAQIERTGRPSSLFEWVETRARMEELAREAMIDVSNTPELRAEFAGLKDLEERYRLHGMADDVAVAFKGTGDESLDDVLLLSKGMFEMSDRRSPEAPENLKAVCSVFAGLARKDGFGTDEILDRIDTCYRAFSGDGVDGLEPGGLYGFRKIIESVDSDRIRTILKAVNRYGEDALDHVPFGREYLDASEKLRKEQAARLFAEYHYNYNGLDAKEFFDDYYSVKERCFTLEEALKETDRLIDRPNPPLKQCGENARCLRERLKEIDLDSSVESFMIKVVSPFGDETRFGRMVDQNRLNLIWVKQGDSVAGGLSAQLFEVAAYIGRNEPDRLKEFFKDCGIRYEGFRKDAVQPFRDAAKSLCASGRESVQAVKYKYVEQIAAANKERMHRQMIRNVRGNKSMTVCL